MGRSLDKLGKYTIVEKIGVGGFGEVYKGYDPFIKRYIAVKTCSTEDQEIRTRFFHEAEIAGNLHHRNVTTVHDFGVQDELPYIIQEYLSGEDLDRKIKRRDFLPFPEKLYYLLQIARGLGYAHTKGVIHRDIKPANIRILEDGTAKIMDFGIARLAQQETGLTQTGMTLGTAAYLAPEQIRGEAVGHPTDLFSFGVLAYELLAYERPFPGKQISTVLFAILNDVPKPLVEHWPGVPDSIQQVISKCLEKDPSKRYANATELGRVLERIRKQGRATHATVDDGPTVLLTKSALTPTSDVADAPSGATSVQAAVPAAPAAAPQVAAPAKPPQAAPRKPVAARRSDSDSHSLDDLELNVSGLKTEEPEYAASQTLVVKAESQSSNSGKVVLVVAMALLAGLAGWWFGARDTTPDNPDTLSDTTIDVGATGNSQGSDPSGAEPNGGGASSGDTSPSGNSQDGSSQGGTPQGSDGDASSDAPAEVVAPPPPPPPGKLQLEAVDWTEEMFVEVGGRRYPMLKSRTIPLEDGTHKATFVLESGPYQARETVSVRMRAGQTQQLSSPIVQPGALSALAFPGRRQGELLLDGEPLASTPMLQRYLAPGSYQLTIRGPGEDGEGIVQEVTIESGMESAVYFDLDAPEARLSSKKLP